jgi:hypothetical protein
VLYATGDDPDQYEPQHERFEDYARRTRLEFGLGSVALSGAF